MKKSIALTGALLSASFLGIGSSASAHPIFGLNHVHINNSPTNYMFVSESGASITADFNRSPLVEFYKQQTGNLTPLDILTLPKLVDEISGNSQVGTYQPSGGLYREIVNYQQSQGAFDYLEFIIPPEGASAIHTHNQGAELFYVKEGTFKIFADMNGNITYCGGNTDPTVCGAAAFTAPDFAVDKSSLEINTINGQNLGLDVGPGSLIYAPAGKTHTWFNSGSTVARIDTILTPGGVGEAFRLAGNVTIGSIAQPLGQEENGVPTTCSASVALPFPPSKPIYCPGGKDAKEGDPNTLVGWNDSDTGKGFYDFNRVLQENPNFFNVAGFGLPTSTPAGLNPLIFNLGAAPKSCTDPLLSPFLTPAQSSGPLSSGSITASIFSITSGETCASPTSPDSQLFTILGGEATFDLGGIIKTAKAGTTVYIPPDKPYLLSSLTGATRILRFDVTPAAIPEPSAVVGLLGIGAYLGFGAIRQRKLKKDSSRENE